MNDKYADKKCFVIMPFGKKLVDGVEFDFDNVYHELIEKSVEELGIECERCDEILDSGSIHKKMFRGIFEADVSVVDITSQNPNVFYELGARHTLQRKVTLVIGRKDNLQKIPFNISGLSILGYDMSSNEQLEANRKLIRDIIRKALDDRDCVDSIIYDALSDLSVGRKPREINSREEKLFKVEEVPDKAIGYITGNIKDIDTVDIWVNSENTNMEMARHYDRSISATIRYEGAKKDAGGFVEDDLIAKDLKKITRGRGCAPGNVIVTTSGELEHTHNVKRIFHAAAVSGAPGRGYTAVENITDCIKNALKKADSAELADLNLQSILFPLMGTGTTRASAQTTAKKLIDAALEYIKQKPNSRIKKIYFLVYNEQDREICHNAFVNDPRIDTGNETVIEVL
jgi:O-acetyl-ADP-ribose deacetylase (regulator of RNase III)